MTRHRISLAIASALIASVALVGCKRNDQEPATTTPAATDATTAPSSTLPPATTTPPASSTTPTTAATVTTVDLGNTIGTDNKIAAPLTAFATTDVIHASVASDGGGGEIGARWLYQDGQVVDAQTKSVPAGPQVTQFSISKPDGFPAGNYKLEISLNGAVTQTRDFQVR